MKILFLSAALLTALLLTVPQLGFLISNPEYVPHDTRMTAPNDDVPDTDTAPESVSVHTDSETAATDTASDTVQVAAIPAAIPKETETTVCETTAHAAAVLTEPCVTAPPHTEEIAAVPSDPSGYDRRTMLQIQGETEDYEISMHDYLIGVVMAEMPASFHEQALCAQAVAARSYLLYRRDNGFRIPDYGSSSTAHFTEAEGRAFFGEHYPSVLDAVTAAVEETDGVVLTYDGDYCCAAYHAMSYGCTEDGAAVWGGDEPYLVSVATPEGADIHGMTTTADYDEASLCAMLGVKAALPLHVTRTDAGRLAAVTAADGTVITGERFRACLRLRATSVEITAQNCDTVSLCVRGYGHGVGMSQYGADAYADAGWTYQEILAHYYPGTTLGLMP